MDFDENTFARMIERAGVDAAPRPEHQAQLRQRAMEVFDRVQAEADRPTFLTRALPYGGWLMRSPISRVAVAVAFVLAITGVAVWFHGGGATPAFADFIRPILDAKGVKYKMTMEMKGPPAVKTTTEVMVLDDARMRQETEMPDGSRMVMIQDMTQGKSLDLLTSSKTATILTFTNKPKYKSAEGRNPLAGYRSLLLDARDNPNIKRESLGEKVIDGRRVIGFHISGERGDMNLWGDPKTGLPVRIKMTMGMDGYMKATMSQFEFNTDMDKSLFSLEPPTGYTVRREKMDASPHEEKDLIEMFREYTKLSRGAFPKSLDMQMVSFMVWKKLNFQGIWNNLTMGIGNGKALEQQRHKLEEQMDEWADKLYDEAMKGKANNEANNEAMVKFQEELRKITAPIIIQRLWEDLALARWKPNEDQRHRFDEQILKAMQVNGKPNEEQSRKMGEETSKIMVQMLWEDLAPTNWKGNAEKRRKFDEQMLKIIEAKENEKQKIKEEVRKTLGEQMLKDVDAWEARMAKAVKARQSQMLTAAKVQEAESQKFTEAQQRVQRGVMFANELRAAADAHYVGKGVLLGAADTPVFWYRPKNSKKYRVIYADLSVREVDTPPSVPNAQPLPAQTGSKK